MADESAARASEVAALFKIHGVDQRSSELVFTHPALDDGGHITLRQDGSNSEDFVPGTSTVIWPCAYTLGDFTCQLSQGKTISTVDLKRSLRSGVAVGLHKLKFS